MARPEFQQLDEELLANHQLAAVERQTAILRNKIQDAIARRRLAAITNENDNVGPSGVLSRIQTMPGSGGSGEEPGEQGSSSRATW